ncbi:hypothetical protein A8926_1396 [Saccharopolyspora spinosa]|uniref:Uncharacterized protein n=1 Tax=Saccharopolyspora spinosa TaxID=60894 RepID=A0A2N3XT69_SACSN|nr:hypothetical protein A8926_1396 [Saccharopolyspora spinosa]
MVVSGNQTGRHHTRLARCFWRLTISAAPCYASAAPRRSGSKPQSVARQAPQRTTTVSVPPIGNSGPSQLGHGATGCGGMSRARRRTWVWRSRRSAASSSTHTCRVHQSIRPRRYPASLVIVAVRDGHDSGGSPVRLRSRQTHAAKAVRVTRIGRTLPSTSSGATACRRCRPARCRSIRFRRGTVRAGLDFGRPGCLPRRVPAVRRGRRCAGVRPSRHPR